jgi:phage baseplate assembly protein W
MSANFPSSGTTRTSTQDAKRAAALAVPIGWPLLGVPDANGELTWPELATSVAQGLRNVLATRAGELLLHPDFGAGLQDFLFEPNTLAVRARIRERIETALNLYEPRALIDRIDVDEDDSAGQVDPRAVRIAIHYHLRRTGEAQRVSLSMSLGG